MKKSFLITLLVIFSTSIFAQFNRTINLPNYDFKRVHWGFSFGIDKMDFIMFKTTNFTNAPSQDSLYGIVHHWNPGAHLGPIVEFNISHYWKLRILVNLMFQQRDLVYYFDHGENVVTIPVASTFIQTPVLIKYNGSRNFNIRPYIIFGGAPTYDISALKHPKDDNPHVFLRPMDVIGEFGSGIEWFLPYFKLSTELKFGRGVFNVLSPDNSVYTKYLQGLYTTYFMFTLHFEG